MSAGTAETMSPKSSPPSTAAGGADNEEEDVFPLTLTAPAVTIVGDAGLERPKTEEDDDDEEEENAGGGEEADEWRDPEKRSSKADDATAVLVAEAVVL